MSMPILLRPQTSCTGLIKELEEALLLQSRISQLQHPQSRVLKALRHFFEEPWHILSGTAKSFLDEKNDLIALKSPGEVDYLSNFLRQHLDQQVRALKGPSSR